MPLSPSEIELMRTRDILKEYASRLIHQTLIQVTGGLGFILTAVLEIFFPGVLIKWVFYIIILVAGLIVGSYFVFADLLREHRDKEKELERAIGELELKISELEDKRPRIVIGLQDEAKHSVKRLEVRLSPCSPRPDLDGLVEKKREELLARQHHGRSSGNIAAAIASAALGRPTPNYREEVEQYLVEYRNFLVRAYESTLDRAYPITPVVENKGRCPASNVTIEFVMPADYKKPAEHQCYGAVLEDEYEFNPFLFPPDEPKPFISPLDTLSNVTIPALSRPVFPQIELPSDISGPFYEEKDGVYHITYSIEKLIQHRPEDDFEPFWLWLADIHHPTTWEIPVRIYAADLPLPEEETVFIDIKVDDIRKIK
jgi:hypothetical protein